MAVKDLGKKFVCYKCATKFYDLKKPEPVCPKCGTNQKDSPANKPTESRRGRLSAVPKIIEPVEPVTTADDDLPAAEDDEEEDEDEAEEP